MAGWASGLLTKEVQLIPMVDTMVAAAEPPDAAELFNAAVSNTHAAVHRVLCSCAKLVHD